MCSALTPYYSFLFGFAVHPPYFSEACVPTRIAHNLHYYNIVFVLEFRFSVYSIVEKIPLEFLPSIKSALWAIVFWQMTAPNIQWVLFKYNILQASQAKSIVSNHLGDKDTRAIWKELIDPYDHSMTTQLQSLKLSGFLTSVRLINGVWKGTQSGFITHFKEQGCLFNEAHCRHKIY